MRLAVRMGLLAVAGVFGLGAAVVAAGGAPEVFLALLLVAVLALRGTLGAGAPERLRVRLGMFVFVGVLAFAAVVVSRVRDALNL